MVQEIADGSYVLDIATGTAEVAIETKYQKPSSFIAGIDPSEGMLNIGYSKIKKNNIEKDINLILGVAESLPFKNNTFDAVTIAYGIRNTVDYIKSLDEIYRVLKPGGKLLILEFAIPKGMIIKPIYLTYFKYIMPFIGSLFGSRKEYKYLSESTHDFPKRENFLNSMRNSGFKQNELMELSLGISILYSGIK